MKAPRWLRSSIALVLTAAAAFGAGYYARGPVRQEEAPEAQEPTLPYVDFEALKDQAREDYFAGRLTSKEYVARVSHLITNEVLFARYRSAGPSASTPTR